MGQSNTCFPVHSSSFTSVQRAPFHAKWAQSRSTCVQSHRADLDELLEQDALVKMGLQGNLLMVGVDILFIVCFFPGSFFLELFCGCVTDKSTPFAIVRNHERDYMLRIYR
jgi:hypothetical protein